MGASFILTYDDEDWPGFIGMDFAGAALAQRRLLDALEARICAVENAGLASVGPSGVPDITGCCTQDAGLMTGWNGLAASVAALEGFRNPFNVVRELWEMQARNAYPHNFLVGDGAAVFAASHQAQRSLRPASLAVGGKAHDTVGCIVSDGERWAVGTSTSGWGGKEPGRVGDAPIPGGGFFANAFGAAFCTWTGEVATRMGLASRAVHALEMGRSLEDSVGFALRNYDRLSGGHIGPVILSVACNSGFAVVGVGFEGGKVPATYTYCRGDMRQAVRRPIPAWTPGQAVPVM